MLQVTGPNGSGKTSLLRIVCGLTAPESGEIRWHGAKIRSLDEEYSRSIAYIGHRIAVKEELNSLENLRISSGLAGCELSRGQAQQALARVGLAGRENLPAITNVFPAKCSLEGSWLVNGSAQARNLRMTPS